MAYGIQLVFPALLQQSSFTKQVERTSQIGPGPTVHSNLMDRRAHPNTLTSTTTPNCTFVVFGRQAVVVGGGLVV